MGHMKCLKNNLENIKKVVNVLRDDGVVAHPADTCYGLVADLQSEKALKRLQAIKGRDAGKPMSIMLGTYLKPELSQFATLNEFSESICEKLLPGPVTIVLPKGPRIPDCFFPEIPTIGIRIPYDSKTNDLLMSFKGPLITTSANLSDQPVCCTCQDVLNAFKSSKEKPDMLLDGEIHGACLPSTVISLKGDQVRILRDGPMGKEQLEAILGVEIQ